MIKDTFCRLPVTSFQCVFREEKYPDAGIILTDDDDDYAQGYCQIEETFRVLINDDILQTYISDHDFRSSTVRADDVGYKIYVFDLTFQQKFTASQPIKVEFKFDGVVPNDVYGYALFKNINLSISTDGQRHLL